MLVDRIFYLPIDHLKHQTDNYEDELRNKVEEKLKSKNPISDTAELFDEEVIKVTKVLYKLFCW